ncbi:hypothetical protein PR048_016021 [Dryococelus australis]|uniref:Uncharacterized protein n=1 Tax=Dryococelus australis TaxID=614101 RepID=A0ABQ9HIL7_9NEOP|nr:hypothetical protein PR048_016021 [Dryococelus australis]
MLLRPMPVDTSNIVLLPSFQHALLGTHPLVYGQHQQACSRIGLHQLATYPATLHPPVITCDSSVQVMDTSLSKELALKTISTTFDELGISPLKLHAVPSHSKPVYGKRKLKSAYYSLRSKFCEVLGKDFPLEEYDNQSVSNDIKQKAEDLDTLLLLIKEKLKITQNRQQKIRLLTSIPISCSRQRIMEEFEVSEYAVRQSRQILNEKGILSTPKPRVGKAFNLETAEQVRNCYENDANSRIMPGKKDIVSFARNVHKQKRLILTNLRELYAAFIFKFAESIIQLSKFCMLRPKWCVLARTSVYSRMSNLSFMQLAKSVNPTMIFLLTLFVPRKTETACGITPLVARQVEFKEKTKANLKSDAAVVLLDSSDHLSYVIQDEAQGYHWSSGSCTVHPAVIYVRLPGSMDVTVYNLCLLSVDLDHNVAFVYLTHKEIIMFIFEKFPFVQKVCYFSDGCAGQYKNCKNFKSLCCHANDFSLEASWTFSATSDGKSQCDGIGGTLKSLVTKESFQRCLDNRITKIDEPINFRLVRKELLQEVRQEFSGCFLKVKTTPGTLGFHQFIPLSQDVVGTKCKSFHENFTSVFHFSESN